MVNRTGLFRSRTHRIIGGVAAGIAYNLKTDPTLIRIIFILLAIFWGGGVLLYLILWIALPEEDLPYYNMTGTQQPPPGETQENPAHQGQPPAYPAMKAQSTAPLVLGLILIAVGAAFLVERFIPRIDFGHLWPIILVIAGVVLILSNFTGTKKSDI